MLVYRVYNKVFQIYFSTKDKAEKFIHRFGSNGTSSLSILEIYVFSK